MKQTVNADYLVYLTTQKLLPQVRCKVVVGPEEEKREEEEKRGEEKIKICLQTIRKEWSCPEEEMEKEKEVE